MKIIELIRVRTGSDNLKRNFEILRQIAKEAMRMRPKGAVQLFQDNSVLGDFAYILTWNDETIDAEGSPLGLKIKESIKTLGIVDYAVWTLIK
ncbi:MAG: hypothetical protein JXA41_06570 [Deltaproteobacteria bacterium]|nr:hypothetical protein [Deltaproteobacteria bacterium]